MVMAAARKSDSTVWKSDRETLLTGSFVLVYPFLSTLLPYQHHISAFCSAQDFGFAFGIGTLCMLSSIVTA